VSDEPADESDASISLQTFRQGLLVAGRRVSAERDMLCALDAAAGDGDLGATLAMGFGHVGEALETSDAGDIGRLLAETGSLLARKSPSTIGALLATAFLRAGKALAGAVELDADDIVAMLRATYEGVADRGGAELGQRTVLDAMDGAVTGATQARDAGLGPFEALRSAAVGASAAADATQDMEPVFGRAAWIADRARGTKDAGAAAWALYVDGLAEGCVGSKLAEAVDDR
jgi:dihydroxyacetone kinase-like protein